MKTWVGVVTRRNYPHSSLSGAALLCLLLLAVEAQAQALPSSADAGRVQPAENVKPPSVTNDKSAEVTAPADSKAIPKDAENVRFILKDVKIEGMTVFKDSEVKDLYSDAMGKEITLAQVWQMAARLTERYRKQGYFLTRAYVPEQRIRDGEVTLNVVEGYVGKVQFDESEQGSRLVRKLTEELITQRPVTLRGLESYLLTLNDLPGLKLRGVLAPLERADDGAVKLVVTPTETSGSGLIELNNYGSRFLGPHQASLTYSASLLPMQQTTATALASVPTKEMQYAFLEHVAAIAPHMSIKVSGNLTHAEPGHTLEPFDVISWAGAANAALNYQMIRQREQNLSASIGLFARKTSVDLLDTPLLRDNIRAVEAGVSYDVVDRWSGTNIIDLTLTQGIDGLGASKENDLNLSRAEAEPDFTHLQLAATRLQGLPSNWALRLSMLGQLASGPLYSSEEIGFGGQNFGRAYDPSEITGDHGLMGGAELRYMGLDDWHSASFYPYAFYDVGVVWNDDAAQEARESASSAGIGVRVQAPWGLSGNLGFAIPLTRDAAAPLYGAKESGPRVAAQIMKQF